MSRNRAEGRSTPSSATQVETSRTRLTGTLRLRGEPLPTQTDSAEQGEPGSSRRIRWAEDVVDNEGLGRKSSKVCCIFHKSRPAGESSSESDFESSSSSDESDSDIDTGEARPSSHRRRAALQQRRGNRESCQHDHNGEHTHPEDEDGNDDDDEKKKKKDNDDPNNNNNKKNPSRRKRKYRPNAYERMPNYNIKKPNGGKEQG